MVFKKIDRYVSTLFLTRALGCALVVVLLYVSFDVMKRLDDIQEAGTAASGRLLLTYYAQVVPLFLLELVPGLALVAAGMTVVSMARSGEMMALKACGASVHRVVAPIFLWTVLASAAVFAARECLAPRMVQKEKVLEHVLDGDVQRDLFLNDAQYSRRYLLRAFDFARGAARNVSVVELRGDGTMSSLLQAASAVWHAGSVQLKTVDVYEFEEGTVRVVPELVLPTSIGRSDLLAATEEGPLAQTLPELRTGARLYPSVPYFSVAFHSRLASAFSSFILLMIGIPFLVGFERSVNSRFLGAMLCIALAAGLYTLTFVFNSMGITESLNATLAGWLPTILGGALGLWLFESMLT